MTGPVIGRDITRRVVVSGRVQGVFFRASTGEQARRYDLHGWVRNRSDGTVEALLSGPEPSVDAMVRWMQDGPPGAVVRDVVVSPADERPEPGFRVLP